jgi:hypothetical protein
MDAAFGADFAGVRVHAASHRVPLGARAFTEGANIHFGPGQFAPDNPAGAQLLAHELGHVVQQMCGLQGPPDAMEAQARMAGIAAAAGDPARMHVPLGGGSSDLYSNYGGDGYGYGGSGYGDGNVAGGEGGEGGGGGEGGS